MFNILVTSEIGKQLTVKKMNNRKKSRKLLLITTVLTIIALASVLSVYAAVTLCTYHRRQRNSHRCHNRNNRLHHANTDNGATWTYNSSTNWLMVCRTCNKQHQHLCRTCNYNLATANLIHQARGHL